MQIPIPWRRGQAKPFGSIPRIDWAHPLTQGLVSYNYDIGGIIIDLVVGGFATGRTGTANPITGLVSPFGSGVKYAGVSGNSDGMQSAKNSLAASLTSAAPYSIATGFLQTGTPNVNDDIVSIWDLSNNVCFQVQPLNTDQLIVKFGNGSYNSTNGKDALNVFHTCAVSVPDATSGNIYCDGALDGSLSSITSTTATTTSQVAFNESFLNNAAGAGSGSGGINGFVYYVAQWKNRVLSASDNRLLHDDPYCFLIYPEDEMFASLIGVQAAAAAIIGGGAVSLQLFAPMTGPLRLTPSGLLVPSLAFPPSVSAAPVVTTAPSSTLPMMGVG